MGTMKARHAVWMRPHYGFVGLLIVLFGTALRIPTAHAVIGIIGFLVCVVALFFVGRATDPSTAKVERINMVLFGLLFLLLTFY